MSENINKIINELHIYEKKLLNELEKDENVTPEEVAENTGMDIKSVMSAAGSLASKNIIDMKKDVIESFQLTKDGKSFADKGLPERRVLNVLKEKKDLPMKDFINEAGLQKFEVNIAMGWLSRKHWAKIDKGIISITEEGKNAANAIGADEKLLNLFSDKNIITQNDLSNDLKEGLKELKSRKNLLKDIKHNLNLISVFSA